VGDHRADEQAATQEPAPARAPYQIAAVKPDGAAAPRQVRSVALLVLATLAVIYTLYFGSALLLPLALAAVLKLLLQPVMRVLTTRLRLPTALAALLVILVVFCVIAGIAFSLSLPASQWLHRAPELLPLLQQKLAILRRPIGYLEEGLKQLEQMAPGGSAGGGQSFSGGSLMGFAGSVFSGTAATLAGFFTTMVLLFFLLASGDRLLRGLVDILPRFSDKRRAVEIADEVESNIARYLLTITMMNGLVGIATGLVMKFTGVGDGLLWGVVAFCLNYVPILGPFTGVVIFFAVGFLSFQSPWYALLPAGLYLLIHIAEGETITPMLLARRFTLNPVLVIVSLFFWHLIWGVPGALLAVPLLAVAKIFCDHIDPLKPAGHLIGS